MPKLFQCTECEERFTEENIKELKFFPSTMICSKCYHEAEKDKTVCFSKVEEYNKRSIVCNKICPDRRICRLYIKLSKYA